MTNNSIYTKDKPRKDSLVDFFDQFGSEDKRIEYFINMNYPSGYVCDHCGCHEYYLIKRKGINALNAVTRSLCLGNVLRVQILAYYSF